MRTLVPLLLLVAFGWLGCGGKAREDACPGDPSEKTEAMTIRCREPLPISFDPVSGEPSIACRLYETFTAGSPQCACDGPSYAPVASVPSSVTRAIRAQEEECVGACCSERCVCELKQLTGTALHECLYQPFTASPTGWCYVDVEQDVGVAGLEPQTSACGRGLRIRSEMGNFEAYLACQF